jgi:hypothetical protein
MSLSSTDSLCNGIPVDHRLLSFLKNTRSLPNGVVGRDARYGGHTDIIRNFGNNPEFENGTSPHGDEIGFATWLANPDTKGGVVFALLQPAKSQVYTKNYEQVKNECASLAYLDDTIKFVTGSEGLNGTSVFDAFPYVTQAIVRNQELTNDAQNAYNTFCSMLDAKRPTVLFGGWKSDSNVPLLFSHQGIGTPDPVERIPLPSGETVTFVNGFHPSYVANYHPDESCFRKLFTLQVVKTFCKFSGSWKEEQWMERLRSRCKERARELIAKGKFSCIFIFI